MDTLRFISDITVRFIQSMGGDHMVVAAARASTSGEEALKYAVPEFAGDNEGLINYMMGLRHGVPFEHAGLTSFVHAPAMVWWEWIRHRVGMTVDCPELSFSLESGRYKKLEPVFWIPRPDRPMVPDVGHKSARPKFVPADPETYEATIADMKEAYTAAWKVYQRHGSRNIANEVARANLGFGVYYSGWVTANPRSLMHF